MTTAPTLSNGTEEESLPILTTSPSITKGEQITSILIAVGLLAILTICIVLLILRTVKTRHPDQLMASETGSQKVVRHIGGFPT
ncbi:hypothetical protein P879_09767 [Paragonimus westermani]|uniref:Uncharacterized protein n=1 Tax=Paragonimus westermani TaxID=34504 RepID=A0A8T0DIF4_9TREM|nr:hypothetical protein P879_09767 [Paragonimus westermani]